MSNSEAEFADAVFAELAKRAEPIFARKLADRGASRPEDLPKVVADKIFKDAFLEAASTNPEADLAMLGRVLDALASEVFRAAFSREIAKKSEPYDAFAFLQRADSAVVLAGLGLPVRPIQPGTLKPLGGWCRTAETARATFDGSRGALVGYDPTTAPFYVALTDCQDTLIRRATNDPHFAELAALMRRQGGVIPELVGKPFQHACMLLPRLKGERPNSVVSLDDDPQTGSIMFIAGWRANGERGGTPGGAELWPVPTRLFNSLITDAMTLFWMTRKPSLLPRRPH